MFKLFSIAGWIGIFLFVLVSSTFNKGCNRTESIFDTTTVTMYDTFFQYDTLNKSYFQVILYDLIILDEQTAVLMSNPVADPEQSEVKMEWGTSSYIFPDETVCPGYLAFAGGQDLTAFTEYTVTLTSNVGNCSASVTVPGMPAMIYPGLFDTLPLNQDVLCSWTPAQGADFYYVLWTAFGYDNDGSFLGLLIDEMYVVDTSHTIPASFFDIQGAVHYFTLYTVTAVCGPLPGNGYNMVGDLAEGVLVAWGGASAVSFYVGTPTLLHTTEHTYEGIFNHEKIFRTYMEASRKTN